LDRTYSTLSGRTLLSTTPRTRTPSCANIIRFISSSSKALPMPPLATSTTSAPIIAAARALETSTTLPTPTWPVPSASTTSEPLEMVSCARRMAAHCASLDTSPSMYRAVYPDGMMTGLIAE